MAYNEQEFPDDFGDGIWCLPEFDGMGDAIDALGLGQPFLAKVTNSNGREYRHLAVTPCDEQQFSIEVCPPDMTENECPGHIQAIYPTITGPCGTDMGVPNVSVVENDYNSNIQSWSGIYETIQCADCSAIPSNCCVDGEYSVWFYAIAEVIGREPASPGYNYRYRVTFFIQDSCGRLAECSYNWISIDC